MLSYSLDELILYAICPYKHKLKGISNTIQPLACDEEQLISTALKDTAIWCFQQKGLGRSRTPAQLSKYFSKSLMQYRAVQGQKTVLFDDMKRLVAAQDIVYKLPELIPDTDELIAVKYPLERTIREVIIKDEVDLIVFRHPPKESSYVEMIYLDTGLDETLYQASLQSFAPSLKANFGYTVVQRDLNPTGLRVQCSVVSLSNCNKKHVLTFKEDQRFNYQRLISNLAKAISQNIYYPRPSHGACEVCTFKQVCNWKI